MPENPTPSGFGTEFFKKVLPGLALAGIVGFGSSWIQSQSALVDLKSRLDRMEEKQRDAAASTAEAARTAQGNAIRLAELGVIQNNLVEQLRDIKADHERLLRR